MPTLDLRGRMEEWHESAKPLIAKTEDALGKFELELQEALRHLELGNDEPAKEHISTCQEIWDAHYD